MTTAPNLSGGIGSARLPRINSSLSALTAILLAFLVALVSLVGIFGNNVYALETANWKGQAVGQDWADLLIAVPWLATTGTLAWRGSWRGSLMLASGLLYTFYEFVIYGLELHFNSLFLPYCAVLGICFFALARIAVLHARADVRGWDSRAAPVRFAATMLFAVGVSFALIWLAEIVPALINGTTPPSVVEAGTPTNAVYVIDLSIVLPAHLIAGISLLKRRHLGFVLGPILLGFDVLMALSIAGMMWVMKQRGLETNQVVATAMLAVATACGLALVRQLRGLQADGE